MKEKTQLEVYKYILEHKLPEAVSRKGNIVLLNTGEKLLIKES